MSIVQYSIMNDIHFPYEGKGYYKALELMRSWPDLRGIYLNGDIAEIESMSTHPKTPTAQRMLFNELEYINQKFDTLQKMFKDIPVDYLCGNHEYRIYRYIRDVAPEMWGMIKEAKLLKFDERPKWNFHEYGPNQLVKIGKANNLYCRHEPLSGGAVHAKGTAEKSLVSIIYGHTHVYQQFTHKKFGPKPISVTAISNGWLGDITKACFDYRGSKDNWQTGFMRIDCDEKTGEWEARFIHL
jgi:hypothetical protein